MQYNVNSYVCFCCHVPALAISSLFHNIYILYFGQLIANIYIPNFRWTRVDFMNRESYKLVALYRV